MAKNGLLRSTMNYVIQARKHPPSDLTAHLYTETRQGATLGGGIPIRRGSVEIISSLIYYGFVANLFVKHVDNKSSQWSLNLMTHMLKAAAVGLYSKIAVNIDKCCRLVNTLDIQLCYCVQRDMVDWA